MLKPADESALTRLRWLEWQLDACVGNGDASPRQVLRFGKELLALTRSQEPSPAVARLLDPAVEAELAAEHREFEDDLELLEWLQHSGGDGADADALAASLAARMRRHVARDARLLQLSKQKREGPA